MGSQMFMVRGGASTGSARRDPEPSGKYDGQYEGSPEDKQNRSDLRDAKEKREEPKYLPGGGGVGQASGFFNLLNTLASNPAFSSGLAQALLTSTPGMGGGGGGNMAKHRQGQDSLRGAFQGARFNDFMNQRLARDGARQAIERGAMENTALKRALARDNSTIARAGGFGRATIEGREDRDFKTALRKILMGMFGGGGFGGGISGGSLPDEYTTTQKQDNFLNNAGAWENNPITTTTTEPVRLEEKLKFLTPILALLQED